MAKTIEKKTSLYKNIPEIELKFKTGKVEKTTIDNSCDAYKVLKNFYNQDTIELTETFIVLFNDVTLKTIGWIKHSCGGSTSVIVDVKLIIATALKCCACSIIVSHNHPTGVLKPSSEDISLTSKIRDACSFFDITLNDHIIINNESYYSFMEEGLI